MSKAESTGGYRRLFLQLVKPAFKAAGGRFEDMIVYSYLCLRLRNRRGNAATVRSIADYTRLATRTVRRSRDRLLKMGLIESQKGKLVAKEPQGDQVAWFHWRIHRENRPWFVRMNYVPVLIPAPDGLSLREAAVLCFLRSWQRKNRYLGRGVQQSSLAKQLCLGRNTIAKAVCKFKKCAILDDGHRLQANPEQLEGHWIDRRMQKPRFRKVESNSHHMFSEKMKDNYGGKKPFLYDSSQLLFRVLKDQENKMHEAGYRAEEIWLYWWDVFEELEDEESRLEVFILYAFDPVFNDAQEKTNTNILLGKFKGPNSLGLLKQQSASVARIINERAKRDGREGLRCFRIDLEAVRKL